jgi:hypothetical protein
VINVNEVEVRNIDSFLAALIRKVIFSKVCGMPYQLQIALIDLLLLFSLICVIHVMIPWIFN